MKNSLPLLKILAVLTMLAFAAGCMTNAQFKESNLVQAGFKKVAATTPAQQAHLQTLSTTKVTQVNRNGQTYFVFPDAANNVLYVGKQAQYNAYKQIKAGEQAQMNYDAEAQNTFIANDAMLTGFSGWGMWDGLGWGY